ncbi:MAG: glycosyl hydrolase [Sulfurimonas sp.]|nr:MAG: glycosyl hydrolase [Sulfurimonas sp.]
MKEPFKWDNYSDQPVILQNKKYKKIMRKKEFSSLVKTFFIALFILPLSIICMPFIKRKKINSSTFFCMGVDFQKEKELTKQLIHELGVQRILIRIKLWEMHSLAELQTFIQENKQTKITLKIMQDRENIEDLQLFTTNLRLIFKTLSHSVEIYEIGTSINRSKWGFFSIDEYNRFYKVAYDLREKEFPSLKIIGSGIIDFEYHFTAHTLFNFFKYKYDGVSSLLYVDRRGAPEHMQLGFALSDKIALLSTMVWLSPKTKHELHITETNYPLSNTVPYAPTSEKECVDEKDYADFMLRYHLLAFASQQVDSLSWHQLISRGYGLIDNIDAIRYTPAFLTYKFMLQNLQDALFLRLDIKRDYYILQCLIDDNLLQIHWTLKPTTLKNEDYFETYSKKGHLIEDETLHIGSSPIYIYILKEVPEKINCL